MCIKRTANIPICFNIGKGIIKDLRRLLSESCNLIFKDFVLVTTENLWDTYSDKFKFKIKDRIFITASDLHNVNLVKEKLDEVNRNSIVFAFGGGKVIDTVKFSATKTGHCYISVPTTLSNDGIYSPVAVITKNRKKVSLGANIPLGIIIDLDIISRSPKETILAGIGDLISNISALKDWELAEKAGVERIDGFSFALSHMAAHYILDLDSVEPNDPIFLKRLAYALVMSGLSMELAGSSRPCSGSEHMFSHALDYLFPEKARPHGIQVAFGTLLVERLRGNKLDKLIDFYKRVNLPTTLDEFRLSKEIVTEALLYAPIVRDRYTIFDEVELNRKRASEILSYF